MEIQLEISLWITGKNYETYAYTLKSFDGVINQCTPETQLVKYSI